MLCLHHEHALEDFTQVAEVERVVRAQWCRQELLLYAEVYVDGGLHQAARCVCEYGRSMVEEALEDAGEYAVHRVCTEVRQPDQVEVSQQSGTDVVPSYSSID